MRRSTQCEWALVAGIAGITALGLACATTGEQYDPFEIPPESFRQRVSTVAVASLEVAPDLAEAARVRALVEPRVLAMLSEAGYRVVPPDEWDRRWVAAASAVGGDIWDPATGERDDERYEAARSRIARDLAAERGVDAILRLDMSWEAIESSFTTTKLCGAPREVYWPGSGLDLGLGDRVTAVNGACLEVRFYDLDYQMLYGIRYGVEWIDTYADQTHAIKPFDQRIRDPALIDQSLDVLLGPLVARARR